MRRVLVIVLDSEANAEEGKSALLQLDSEGSISIYGYEVIAKKADGTVIVPQGDGHGMLSPFTRPLLGGLRDSTHSIPASGAKRASYPADSSKTETGKEFIHDVMEILLPNRVAIVADIEEEWPTILDRHMASIASAVFRWTVSETQHAIEM